MTNPDDIYVPPVDVCAICSDSECDGVGCICGLDPNDESDIPRLERLQNLVRWGLAWERANELIAYAEGRWSPPPGEPDEGEPHPWLCPHGATLLCMVCGDLSSGDNKE